MINRIIATGLAVVFFVFAFCLYPVSGISAAKDATPKISPTTPAVKAPAPVVKPSTPVVIPPSQLELNAAIEKIFIKDNRVFVILNRTGSGRIAPEDYAKIMMRIETSKGPRQWNLSEIDKTRSLSTGTGRVEFDTGIILDKSETVRGILSLGKIEKPKQGMLVMAPTTAPKPTPTPPKPTGTMAAQVDRPQGAAPRPVPLIHDMGIRISPPASGSSYYQGEPISLHYEWTHSSAPSGNIEFSLQSMDMDDSHAVITVPVARSGTVTLTPPATMPVRRYAVVGFNRDTGAFGRSDDFEVARNSARIDFLSPARGDVYHPGDMMTVRYTLNNRVEPGIITFLFGSEGRVARMTQAYTPPAPIQHPLPEYSFSFRIPNTTPVGEYGVIAMHSRASGIGPVFSVARRTFGDGGGDETVFTDCDYGIESATFEDGRALDTGFDPGILPSVRGTIRTRIQWNRIAIPSVYPPGTDFKYEIQLYSTVTGERIGFGEFRYSTLPSFDVYVVFTFAKDDIPRMSRDRFMPLEFRLVKLGESIDANPFNNVLTANMRILNVVENNMEIDFTGSLSLTRRTSTTPINRYEFTQRFRLRNLSRSEVGGPPSPVNVSVKGCMYRRDAGESWESARSLGCKTITVNNAVSDWISRDFTDTFTESRPWDIPNDTRFRLVLEVDPNKALIDTNRANNVRSYTFRITEGPPGTGSGTVVGD